MLPLSVSHPLPDRVTQRARLVMRIDEQTHVIRLSTVRGGGGGGSYVINPCGCRLTLLLRPATACLPHADDVTTTMPAAICLAVLSDCCGVSELRFFLSESLTLPVVYFSYRCSGRFADEHSRGNNTITCPVRMHVLVYFLHVRAKNVAVAASTDE